MLRQAQSCLIFAIAAFENALGLIIGAHKLLPRFDPRRRDGVNCPPDVPTSTGQAVFLPPSPPVEKANTRHPLGCIIRLIDDGSECNFLDNGKRIRHAE